MLIPLYKSNVLVLQRNIISTIYSAWNKFQQQWPVRSSSV
jgi:hypothetical protein